MSDARPQALRRQAAYCRDNGSPFTAAVCEAAAADVERGGPFAALLAPWAEADARRLSADAVPLRLAGALHGVARSGVAPELAASYPPAPAPADLASRLTAAAEAHADALAGWLASPPQTNEVRRAMGLFPGFLDVARRTGLPLRTLEIGASAGLLTAWDRFAFGAADASWRWGAPDAVVALDTDWRGGPPRLAPIEVVSRRACDVAPIRVAEPGALSRLEAYVWPDQPERMARLHAAAGLAVAEGIEVERADAGDWLGEHLRPEAGAATVLYHSVMFQYLPAASREAVFAAVRRASAQASPEAPLAWLRFEPAEGEPAYRFMEVRLALWPGGGERLVARAHAHGAWVEPSL